MSVIKKPIKVIAVIIDIKDFPKSCVECPFCIKVQCIPPQCIPQGALSIISTSKRPDGCPLRTAYAYAVEMAGGK